MFSLLRTTFGFLSRLVKFFCNALSYSSVPWSLQHYPFISFHSSLAICVPLVTFLPGSYKSRFISPHYPLALISKTVVPVRVTSILDFASSTMACLHVVIQIDGFQYGEGQFHFKALGMAHPKAHKCQLRRFDTTPLLGHSPAAISTCRCQARQHGWPLNSHGLPSTMAGNCVLAFLQDTLLDTAESGSLPQSRIVLWAKGLHQCRLTTSLLSELPDIDLRLTLMVRNLEELDCPPARQLTELQPDHQPTTMTKLLAISEWLLRRDLV